MPEVVESVSSTLGASGSHRIALAWPHAMRADRYHAYGVLLGNPTPVLLATVSDESAVIESVPSGTAVFLTVTAVNDAGESTPSEPLNVTAP